eukprot:NODE_1270_length_2540_cov_4.551181.p1 GENE.NODE_1270_length_2540_cov_4.551181~~NODE_1270_length_2540_cov_4.551181.p1  ORF type:complete len:672 (+),score=162.95 NODE_1270_length_2540_cov_4.551181:361-2376(+)
MTGPSPAPVPADSRGSAWGGDYNPGMPLQTAAWPQSPAMVVSASPPAPSQFPEAASANPPRSAPSLAQRRRARAGVQRLVRDLRLSMRNRGGKSTSTMSRAALTRFVTKAQGVMQHCSFADVVDLFYWLTKCVRSAGHGRELSDEVMLAYNEQVRTKALGGTEMEIVRVVSTMFNALNKNKIAYAVGNDAQLHLESAMHDLLTTALPRFRARHAHLPLSDIVAVLSVYAKAFRQDYMSLFESVKPCVIRHAQDSRVIRSEEHRRTFFHHGPFVLFCFAQARCSDTKVFDAYLQHFEPGLWELRYDYVAIIGHALSRAGIMRPSFWLRARENVAAHGSEWSLHGLGQLISACQKVLTTGGADGVKPLLRCAAGAVMARGDEATFREAVDLVMAMAALPSASVGESEWRGLLHFALGLLERTSDNCPPVYLAAAFHAAVALKLCSEVSHVDSALRALARDLGARHRLCEAAELQLMGDALCALARRGSPDLLEEISIGQILAVQQREVVRKAHDFPGMTELLRTGRRTVSAVRAVAAVLQPWFASHVIEYVGQQADAAAEVDAQVQHELVRFIAAARAAGPDVEGVAQGQQLVSEVAVRAELTKILADAPEGETVVQGLTVCGADATASTQRTLSSSASAPAGSPALDTLARATSLQLAYGPAVNCSSEEVEK